MDAVVKEDDIRAVIVKTDARIKPDIIKVTSFRPMNTGNLAATIRQREEKAKRLTAARIKIGLSICRVGERVDTVECFKCWHYGHRASQCRGEDRSRRCLKCTGLGHSKRDCEESAYCPLCDQAGHEAGGRRRKVVKKALLEARNKGGHFANKHKPKYQGM